MGGNGPAPQPTILRILHGNPSKTPIPDNEPIPEPVNLPPAPQTLTDPVAAAEWNKLVLEFHKMKMLGMVDLGILETYCQSWAQWRAATAKLSEHGTVVMGPKGFPVVSPYMKIADAAFAKILPLMRELGLTPASRTRIRLEKEVAKDKTAEFLFGGKKRA